jgi:hypothetical protein
VDPERDHHELLERGRLQGPGRGWVIAPGRRDPDSEKNQSEYEDESEAETFGHGDPPSGRSIGEVGDLEIISPRRATRKGESPGAGCRPEVVAARRR